MLLNKECLEWMHKNSYTLDFLCYRAIVYYHIEIFFQELGISLDACHGVLNVKSHEQTVCSFVRQCSSLDVPLTVTLSS